MEFIYVFTKEDRDALSKAGFYLLKNDEISSVFIFYADGKRDFSEYGITNSVLSSTVTF